MANGETRALSRADLERASRTVAAHFGVNTIYVVGSQALLVMREDLPKALRYSVEFDIYPDPCEVGQLENAREASEEIAALFGDGSNFHRTHGFYIDGVDDRTATLPPDWRDRSLRLEVTSAEQKIITVIAPDPNDLVAAKLVRGLEKDVEFAARCMGEGFASNQKVKEALNKSIEGDHLSHAQALADKASRFKNRPDQISQPEISDDELAAFLRSQRGIGR